MHSTRQFLDLMYDDAHGIAYVAHALDDGPYRQKTFNYPEQADEMIAYSLEMAETHHVWYSTSVMKSASRTKGNSVKRVWLHCDLDAPPDEVQQDAIDSLGAVLVQSGTAGHLHIYVKLDRSVDVQTYHSLERRLRDYIGAGADAKIGDSDVLRLPGTLNHKTIPPVPVVLLDEEDVLETPSFTVWTLAALDGILPADIGGTRSEGSSAPIEPHAIPIPQAVTLEIRKRLDYQGRSGQMVRIVNECKREGLSLNETLYVLLTVQTQRDRWFNRTTNQNSNYEFMFREVSAKYADSTNESRYDAAADYDFLRGN